MDIKAVTELVVAFAPIVAAVTGVITVTLGRTIHGLVNSALAAVKEDLRLANERIEALQAWVILVSERPKGAPRLAIPARLMQPPSTPPTVAKLPL